MAGDKMGSKSDAIVKLVLVFFISLLSFSIGTFVGKKFSDNQYRLSKYEPNATEGERDVASVHETTEVKPKDALSDDEVAKLAEEFITDDKHEAKAPPVKLNDKNAHGTTDAKATPPAETPKAESPKAHTETAAPQNSAARLAQGMAPETIQAALQKGPRLPSSLPRDVAAAPIGKFTVQVGSYPTEDEAQKIAGDLKSKGFSAFYVKAVIKDPKAKTEKTWYRVGVGLFTTKPEASEYMKDLMKRSKVSSAIVQQISE